jgi:hypothetical protein
MILPLAGPLFKPGMAAFSSGTVKSRLRGPTINETLAQIRAQRSRLDIRV